MKQVIITGATGMIGSVVLQHCLASNEIGNVLCITRKPLGISHPKLKEVLHSNFLDYHPIGEHFENIDIAYFCIGVYTGAVSNEKFKEITVDYTQVFTDTLKKKGPNATLCFLSGAGADRAEKSRTSFAKYKGMAENCLADSGLDFYSFRPAYIYPVEKRKEPNLMYSISRALYPLIKLFGKNASITSQELGEAMFKVGLKGAEKSILENQEILQLVSNSEN